MRYKAMLMAGALALAAAIPGAIRAADKAASAAPGKPAASRVVLLGTGGGPIARVGRSQPANLLQVGGKTYLIDIGDGTPRQLARAGVALSAVDAVFVTHLHFDHTAGIMGFLALDWQARRRTPVIFYGPPGTRGLVDNTLHALGSGEAIFRPQLPDLPAMASVFSGQDWEVTAAREVFRDAGVTVRAVENSHYGTMHLDPAEHGINRSYSYRFDMADHSVVFTGDTGPSRAVEDLARGADVLVSEIIDIDAIIAGLKRRQQATGVDQQPLIDHMVEEHLTPENVGRMAAAAGVKTLVLSHFATPPGIETFDRKAMLAAIRKHYRGRVIFGADLTEI
jgi:ribonuclease BN (tRNA processing enzyme)